MAIRRNPGFKVFNARLLVGLDKLLRSRRRYQGDLSASINDALLAVNLDTVKLVTLQGKRKQTARETQIVILRRLIHRIKTIANTRACSISQLVNSGLMAYYSKKWPGKLGTLSRPTRQAATTTYDKMSPQARRQLIEAIADLNGLQEGPKDTFPDGTHYQYDPDLKRTVEVNPSRELVPVALVAGKLHRDLEKLVASRTIR